MAEASVHGPGVRRLWLARGECRGECRLDLAFERVGSSPRGTKTWMEVLTRSAYALLRRGSGEVVASPWIVWPRAHLGDEAALYE